MIRFYQKNDTFQLYESSWPLFGRFWTFLKNNFQFWKPKDPHAYCSKTDILLQLPHAFLLFDHKKIRKQHQFLIKKCIFHYFFRFIAQVGRFLRWDKSLFCKTPWGSVEKIQKYDFFGFNAQVGGFLRWEKSLFLQDTVRICQEKTSFWKRTYTGRKWDEPGGILLTLPRSDHFL